MIKEDEDKQTQTFLTFRLGDEIFAAHIEKASNIIEMMPITKVPRSPAYMKGIINLRGTVLPVIETRMKFGLEPKEYTRTTVIVVFNVSIEDENSIVGAIVDEPGKVLEIAEENIQPPPTIGAKYKSDLIEGMIKPDDEDDFIMLLDIDKVFSMQDLIEINETAKSTEQEESNIDSTE